MDAKELGRTGEEVATDYLIGLGWTVLDRNWRFSGGGHRGELDVVARDLDNCLVIVEVKTRSGCRYGTGFEAITVRKAAQLRALTARWLLERAERFERVRIDAVAVFAPPGGPVTLEHRQGVV